MATHAAVKVIPEQSTPLESFGDLTARFSIRATAGASPTRPCGGSALVFGSWWAGARKSTGSQHPATGLWPLIRHRAPGGAGARPTQAVCIKVAGDEHNAGVQFLRRGR